MSIFFSQVNEDPHWEVDEERQQGSSAGAVFFESLASPEIGKRWKTDLPQEIFATFGEIKEIEFGSERQRPWLNKGFAYIEYKTHTDALNAMKHMDGGQIDGQVIMIVKHEQNRKSVNLSNSGDLSSASVDA